MAENQALISLVKPAMEELGKLAVVKIKHLFAYLCCFNNNIQGLNNEAQKLEDARVRLQMRVEEAENDARVILPEVTTWLKKAGDKIQVDKSGIDNQIPTLKNGCWSVKSRLLLSRKAEKLTGEMKQLMEDCNKFNHISMPPLPAAQAEILLRTEYDFQSRKQIEEDIMNALRAKEVTTMGIYGMGGVGKTTMAKRIMGRAKKENIFHEIVMVVVSQQVDNLKIQGAIAESLDLKLSEETLLVRATKLRGRLTREKRILIVFDDVWDKLKLEDLGIPCGNERCTILFTSRNKDVLEKMAVQNVYGVEILSDEEAWLFFREKTGSCVADPNLLSTAKEVARECKCLPIALITIGGALKNQTNIAVWEYALQQLKSSNPGDIEDVIKDVYNPLKLSYTYLGNRHAQSLFLLCSLFPKDVDISLEELTLYCIGLRIFPNLDFALEGVLETVRGRVSVIVDVLKNRFLLLNGRDVHHVRMHDVVRDVAIYIASHGAEEETVNVKFNPTYLSSEYAYTYWVSVFSEETSSLLRMHASGNRFEIKDFSLFEEMKELNVLSFNFISLNSLSLKIEVLKNLRTLYLFGCTSLETMISVVDELLSLEILICRSCDMILELPVEFGRLKNLRMLEIEIEDSTVAAETFLVGANAKYQIRFGGSRWESCEVDDTCGFARWIKHIVDAMVLLKHDKSTYYLWGNQSPPDHFFHQLEAIEIYDCSAGSLFHSLTAVNLDGLKELRISKCKNMVKVIENEEQFVHLKLHALFPSLHSLYLEDLPELKSFSTWSRKLNLASLENVWIKGCHRLEFFAMQSVELHSLKKVVIRDCNNIGSLFSPYMAANLGNLTTLSISRCKEMVQVVEKNYAEPCIIFPDLKELEFHDLPKLQSFSNSEYDLELPSLENVQIKGCHCLEFFRMQNVQLRSLKKVAIIDCNHIGSLFSVSMGLNLHNLTTLSISGCKEMVQVINNYAERELDILSTEIFPNLKELEFRHLPMLQSFCNLEYHLELPSLENVWIYSCPLWEKFSIRSVSAPNLKRVEINSKVINRGTTLEWLNTSALREANQFHQPNSAEKELKFSSVLVRVVRRISRGMNK